MTNSAKQSSKSTGRKPLSMETSRSLLPTPQAIDGQGEGRPLRLKKDMKRNPDTPGSWRGDLKDYISSLVGFPASPSPKPDEERERRMTATSGLKCLPLYETPRRRGSSLKMLVA